MDKDVNRLAAVTSGALIILLLIITGVSVKPYQLIEQEHLVYSGSQTVTNFDHPLVLPTTSHQPTSGSTKTTLGEWLQVSPYEHSNNTAGWSYSGAGEEAEYVCRITWTTGYSVYFAGVDVFDGSAPWKNGNLTLVDAHGSADGRRNELHLPEYFRIDSPASTTTG